MMIGATRADWVGRCRRLDQTRDPLHTVAPHGHHHCGSIDDEDDEDFDADYDDGERHMGHHSAKLVSDGVTNVIGGRADNGKLYITPVI